jgi:hypothetical protein
MIIVLVIIAAILRPLSENISEELLALAILLIMAYIILSV